MHITKEKRTILKDHIYWNHTYCTNPTMWRSEKRPNNGKSKMISGWQILVEEGWIGRIQKNLRKLKCSAQQYNVIKHLSKVIECITPEVKCNGNLRLRMITMWWCKFAVITYVVFCWEMLLRYVPTPM